MNKKNLYFLWLICISLISSNLVAQDSETKLNSSTFSSVKFRSIGPASESGRIADLAVNPDNPAEYYVAVASGGLWKTVNAGTTYESVFDGQASYSLACVAIAPSNSKTVWAGTGENNNQRAIGYGDGVYKSMDGGKTWKNMGLKKSEHIGKIIIHPKNENIVFVAAYGPLWSSGGERGFYVSYNGGETWEKTLDISENTGISDIAMDPSNPEIMYATAHQRRRHVFTYISGGPECAAFKSLDGGKTWKEMKSGLPVGEMGRIAIAVSPVDPNYVYIMCEGMYDKGGFYRSTDKGVTWEKMSKYHTSGNYYTEIYCDPKDRDKVFSMDTWLHHTEDGGKNFINTGEKEKHVDNHAMWIDPNNTNHWLVGCDGGIYETWDHANNWQYKPNLPVMQFYRVAVDNDYPFYNVYGGTQDNFTVGGPSRTINNAGIVNDDWFVVNGGDGFEPQVDPTAPNIVYAQSQYGGLVRYDKKSGESLYLKPLPGKGEKGYRWNWDSPLLISPHNHQRIYFAANKLFMSNDRGNTWKTISPDLTRKQDRNKLPVMGRVWSMDAVAKNRSTSIYGNIVALDESPVQEGLLFVGTDDGLIHISSNNGKDWSTIDGIKGVPAQTYVSKITASRFDVNKVYASFNNSKNGDFKPYVFMSNNKGKTWSSMSGNLPKRGSVYAIEQDHVDPNLLFVGTEFGFFFSKDNGISWIQLKSGLPPIPVRDIEVVERENDVVLATFGRGFYVLDDYSILRSISKEKLTKKAEIYPIRTTLKFHPRFPLGLKDRAHKGASYFIAPNPEFGVHIYYSLGDDYTSLKDKRKKEEANKRKEGENVYYPSIDKIKEEIGEFKKELIFVFRDVNGNEIQRLVKEPKKGLNKIVWDLKTPTTSPVKLETPKPGRYSGVDEGPMVQEGKYTVELHILTKNGVEKLTEPVEFEVKDLKLQSLAGEPSEIIAFQKQVMEINRQIGANNQIRKDIANDLKLIKKVIKSYPQQDLKLYSKVATIGKSLNQLALIMDGDNLAWKLQMESAPTVNGRLGYIRWAMSGHNNAPTTTMKEALKILTDDFNIKVKPKTLELIKELHMIQEKLKLVKTPYIPINDLDWNGE